MRLNAHLHKPADAPRICAAAPAGRISWTKSRFALPTPPAGYADWLADLKTRIHNAQQRSTLAVNRELVMLYWQIGKDILERQAR